MIREASYQDIPSIVDMSRKFYATTSYSAWADFSAETVAALTRTLIDTGVMLVAEEDGENVGMVGLFIGPFMFNSDHVAAYEVVWWVNPSAQGAGVGKALLEAIEPACRAKGASTVQMVALASSPPQASAMYERAGYTHSESSYTKVL